MSVKAAEAIKSEAAKSTDVAKPKAPQQVACEVRRDFWPKEGQRVRKGTVVDVDPEAAMAGIEKGILRRVKKGT
jgi:hypothetical protein